MWSDSLSAQGLISSRYAVVGGVIFKTEDCLLSEKDMDGARDKVLEPIRCHLKNSYKEGAEICRIQQKAISMKWIARLLRH